MVLLTVTFPMVFVTAMRIWPHAVAIVIIASMALAIHAQNSKPVDEKWEAPPEAAAKPNPERQNPEASAVGRKRYMRLCVTCHDEDGNGQAKSAADLGCPAVQGQSDGALFGKITNGNLTKGMPAFEAVPENERWDIVIFLRTLKGAEGDCEKKNGAK